MSHSHTTRHTHSASITFQHFARSLPPLTFEFNLFVCVNYHYHHQHIMHTHSRSNHWAVCVCVLPRSKRVKIERARERGREGEDNGGERTHTRFTGSQTYTVSLYRLAHPSGHELSLSHTVCLLSMLVPINSSSFEAVTLAHYTHTSSMFNLGDIFPSGA